MGNVCEFAELSFQTIDVLGFGAIQSLQRNWFICQSINRFVHDAHSAGAEFAAQTESFSPLKFSSCFDHSPAMLRLVARVIDRCDCALHDLPRSMFDRQRRDWKEFTWTGACC